MNQKSFVERRKNLRLKTKLRMEVEYPKGSRKIFVTETINLSEAGIYCNLHKDFAVMTKLFCILLIPLVERVTGMFPYRRVQCETIVVRRMEKGGDGEEGHWFETALFISDISDRDREAIRTYLDRCNAS